MKYPKFKNAGTMLCALEMEMDKGKHRFHLLMKDGTEETLNIAYLGEDDITIADDDMQVCGYIEDSDVESFLPAE